MKKALVAAVIGINIAVSMNIARASYCAYTSGGYMFSSDSVYSENSPGVIVGLSNDIFTNCISKEQTYSVYANSYFGETLTLGIVAANRSADDNKKLQQCVNNQIQYIKKIGGNMTGYSIVSDPNQSGRNALNISWNIGSAEHHFARFELDISGGSSVGYYDVLYTDNGVAQYSINEMNTNMCVKCGAQNKRLSENEARERLKAWIGDLGTWVDGYNNSLLYSGLYNCNGKNYHQFVLKGMVDGHWTLLDRYVISEDGTDIFEGECTYGYLDRW